MKHENSITLRIQSSKLKNLAKLSIDSHWPWLWSWPDQISNSQSLHYNKVYKSTKIYIFLNLMGEKNLSRIQKSSVIVPFYQNDAKKHMAKRTWYTWDDVPREVCIDSLTFWRPVIQTACLNLCLIPFRNEECLTLEEKKTCDHWRAVNIPRGVILISLNRLVVNCSDSLEFKPQKPLRILWAMMTQIEQKKK